VDIQQRVTIQVPATTANLGPGFDALGVALNCYNHVILGQEASDWEDPFFSECADLFFHVTSLEPRAFAIQIEGDVPRSRGLGSSVTVRLGILAALNEKFAHPLNGEQLFRLVTGLEGHPDNAAPACFGGFVAGSAKYHHRFAVGPELKFVTAIPDYHLETDSAREILPDQIPFEDAVTNIQNTALITAAFASADYRSLHGAFGDCLHQPHRLALIPGGKEAIQAAEESGALGAFISGAGPAIMALTLENQEKTEKAMQGAFATAGQQVPVMKTFEACNVGWKRI